MSARPAHAARPPARALLIAAALAACAAAPVVERPSAASARPVACPASSFFPPDTSIVLTVPRGYGRIDLGHGHSLEFDEGAVPVGSRYRVSRASGEHAALRIEPVDGAPVVFQGLARLRVNFAPCGVERLGPGFGVYRWKPDDTMVPVPSEVSGFRVDAFLTGFSAYAIGSN